MANAPDVKEEPRHDTPPAPCRPCLHHDPTRSTCLSAWDNCLAFRDQGPFGIRKLPAPGVMGGATAVRVYGSVQIGPEPSRVPNDLAERLGRIRKCGATLSLVVVALIARPSIGVNRSLPESSLSLAAPQILMLSTGSARATKSRPGSATMMPSVWPR